MQFGKQLAMIALAAYAKAADVADADVCRALVMSGGASNGAWEAGILWGLVNYGDPADFAYDVITGISAGAINTAGLAGFAPDQQIESAQFLSDTWANLNNRLIWQTWENTKGEGIIDGCLKEQGCLDDSPALSFLEDTLAQFPEGYKRRVTVGSGSVNTGEFVTFDQKDTSFADLHQAALASGSIPGIFPPQHLKDMILMDGGTIYDVNLISAVQQCLEVVDDESKIIIDIAICSQDQETGFDLTKNAGVNYLRSFQMRRHGNGMNAIQWQKASYPDANYRYLFYQQETVGTKGDLDFRNVTTWPLQEQGRKQAQETVQAGEGTNFKALDDWMADREQMKAEYTTFGSYLRSFIPAI